MPRAEQLVIPPLNYVLVSAAEATSDVDLPDGCRGIIVETSGTLNVTMANGEEKDSLPFMQGMNPGFFSRVRISPGGARNIWAVV